MLGSDETVGRGCAVASGTEFAVTGEGSAAVGGVTVVTGPATGVAAGDAVPGVRLAAPVAVELALPPLQPTINQAAHKQMPICRRIDLSVLQPGRCPLQPGLRHINHIALDTFEVVQSAHQNRQHDDG
jgi:hypothetical protein